MLGPETLRVYEPVHVYHMSMSKEDYDLIVRLREGDKERDWNEVTFHGDRRADLGNRVQPVPVLRREEPELAGKGVGSPVPAGGGRV